ncbi:hypothetical protein CEXT_57261 [Caerostris extrusa]|uniref:Uncharacterized protein n=1 Tax=Caerostris extrusa TaxID=172846 RepID=A0AAV4MDA1_CAEEX|nr:hypothetical protein CEXT_57261 [Caerostris extrusa]
MKGKKFKPNILRIRHLPEFSQGGSRLFLFHPVLAPFDNFSKLNVAKNIREKSNLNLISCVLGILPELFAGNVAEKKNANGRINCRHSVRYGRNLVLSRIRAYHQVVKVPIEDCFFPSVLGSRPAKHASAKPLYRLSGSHVPGRRPSPDDNSKIKFRE